MAVSGTAFTTEHAALIKRMTENLVLALDADQAGIKAAGRAARVALQSGLNVKVAQLPAEMDPADLILKQGADAWKGAIRDSKDVITFLLDVLQQHAPEQDKFRRNVEAVVLPFLSDVQSPIAREQYVHEIAKRLTVSEVAVAEAVNKLPQIKTPSASTSPGAPAGREHDPSVVADRVRHAYALLLWQESLPRAAIDTKKYESGLETAIGADAFAILKALPKNELESLRFSAEMLYGKTATLEREAQAIVDMLHMERLRSELTQATVALKEAELGGDEPEVARCNDICKLLTARIAERASLV